MIRITTITTTVMRKNRLIQKAISITQIRNQAAKNQVQAPQFRAVLRNPNFVNNLSK
jgi:hypothetical protein